MIDISLLKSQKNEILAIIRELGLDPFQFQWGETPSRFPNHGPATKLSYRGSEYYFIFDIRDNGHYSFFSPALDKRTDERSPGMWELQVGYVREWLEALKREIEQIDEWEEAVKPRLPHWAEIDPASPNEPFSQPEAERLAEGMETVRTHLNTLANGNEVKTEVINGKIDYLINAAKRQGRQDWFHTCNGALMSLLNSLALSQEQAHHVWAMHKETLGEVMG